MTIKKISVFCGAHVGKSSNYKTAGEQIGKLIAEKGLEGMQGMGILMKELKNLHPNADMSQASNYDKEFLS